MMKKNNLMKGVIFAFITSIISGVAIFYSKISVAKIDPLILTFCRNFYVGLVFFLIVTVKENIFRHSSKKNFLSLLAIGLIGGGIPFFLFFNGLKLIGAQTANIIHKTLFLWVTFLAVVFLKERLNPLYFISYLLVFFGTFFFTPLKITFVKGELFVLLATFLWAVENIIAKKTLRYVSANLVGFFRMGVGSIILFILILFTGKLNFLFSLNFNQLITIIIGGTILFFYVFFWYRALKYAPASLVTFLLTFSLVVGNILLGGFGVLRISEKQIISSLFIAAGSLIVYLTVLPKWIKKVF